MLNILTHGMYSAFNPLNYGTCECWLDARDLDTITKDGGDLVSSWVDKSPNARAFDQGTGANQPLWEASGLSSGNASIMFDSTTAVKALVSTAAASVWSFLQQDHTIFVILEVDGGAGVARQIINTNSGAGSTTIGMRYFISTGNALSVASTNGGGVASTYSNTIGTPTLSTPYLLDSCYEEGKGGDDSSASFRTSGATTSNTSETIAASSSSAPDNTLSIGARPGISQSAESSISTILMYSDVLSQAKITKIRSQLIGSWNL